MVSTPQKPPPETPEIPRDLAAEFAVLGYYAVGGVWREDVNLRDFTLEKHQSIWCAMRAIHEAGDDIDRQRVAVELGEKELKHVGLGYLTDLGEGCFPEMNIEPYVRKLHDAATQRDVLHHAHILMTHVHSGDRTTEELIDIGAAAFASMKANVGSKVEPVSTIPTWPDPIHEGGFHGIAGELVRVIEPHSEADPAALLVQFLVAWGSLVGRGPYYLAEADRHHTNEYSVIVGNTAKGRKGRRGAAS